MSVPYQARPRVLLASLANIHDELFLSTTLTSTIRWHPRPVGNARRRHQQLVALNFQPTYIGDGRPALVPRGVRLPTHPALDRSVHRAIAEALEDTIRFRVALFLDLVLKLGFDLDFLGLDFGLGDPGLDCTGLFIGIVVRIFWLCCCARGRVVAVAARRARVTDHVGLVLVKKRVWERALRVCGYSFQLVNGVLHVCNDLAVNDQRFVEVEFASRPPRVNEVAVNDPRVAELELANRP